MPNRHKQTPAFSDDCISPWNYEEHQPEELKPKAFTKYHFFSASKLDFQTRNATFRNQITFITAKHRKFQRKEPSENKNIAKTLNLSLNKITNFIQPTLHQSYSLRQNLKTVYHKKQQFDILKNRKKLKLERNQSLLIKPLTEQKSELKIKQNPLPKMDLKSNQQLFVSKKSQRLLNLTSKNTTHFKIQKLIDLLKFKVKRSNVEPLVRKRLKRKGNCFIVDYEDFKIRKNKRLEEINCKSILNIINSEEGVLINHKF